jgi:dTDP-4-dehydrorhamnose 3,5-epimerase
VRFTDTPLHGVTLIDLDPVRDERGSFARTFCDDEFERAGIPMRVRQTNLSNNPHALTLRGLHYQDAPFGESKVVQCTRGRIFDVVVDLRSGSPSLARWFATELGPELQRAIFIPQGCAHGFLTLEESSDVFYLMGHPYVPEARRGARWNDPAFNIPWPAAPRFISPRDTSYPDFITQPDTRT